MDEGLDKEPYTPRGVTKPPLDIPKFAMGARLAASGPPSRMNIGGTSCGATPWRLSERERAAPLGRR